MAEQEIVNDGRVQADVRAEEAAAAQARASQSGKTKDELIAEAEAAGIEVQPGDTKADIQAKLQG